MKISNYANRKNASVGMPMSEKINKPTPCDDDTLGVCRHRKQPVNMSQRYMSREESRHSLKKH